MTVKYHCPKCERRFVDWGAKKLEFMCPDCEKELVMLGGSTGKTKSKPSLRRPAPVADTGPRRVTSFGSDDGDEIVKPVVAASDSDEEFDSSSDAGTDIDDDEGDIDLSADSDEPAEVDDSDD